MSLFDTGAVAKFTVFKIIAGDDYLDDRRLAVTVVDRDGARVDLTGADITFVVRASGDSLALIEKVTPTQIEIASPQTGDTKGVAYVELDAADTEDLSWRYLWVLRAVDAVGRITLARGSIYVVGDLVTTEAS